jgi:hypothetical protein
LAALVTVFVLKTTGTPLGSTTPELAPAFWSPPPPLPLTWASSRVYRRSRARFAPDPGTACSRVFIRTVSRAGSVMYVVTSRKPWLASVEVTVQAMPVGSAATV